MPSHIDMRALDQYISSNICFLYPVISALLHTLMLKLPTATREIRAIIDDMAKGPFARFACKKSSLPVYWAPDRRLDSTTYSV